MKLTVLICAALGFDTFKRNAKAEFWKKLSYSPVETVFPALTCPFQASLRTASTPDEHKIKANGFLDREIRKTFFWEQSSELIKTERIWKKYRENGGKVAQICLQQSLGNDSDIIISPAPIHKHHGGMIQDCYSNPPELYSEICAFAKQKFNLFDYWGPFTSHKSSQWISAAVKYTIINEIADLVFAYIPHLDYDLQRYGIGSKNEAQSFAVIENILNDIYQEAKNHGFEILILGDYQIENVQSSIYPNQILAEKGIFKTRTVKGMLYPDIFSSGAFAICDHQIADIYVFDQNIKDQVFDIFKNTNGIGSIKENKTGLKTSDFTITACDGKWFSYKWWKEKKQAPDYATHVDIHNKPGYDPCELFLSIFPPMSISLDDNKVKGSHGSVNNNKKFVLSASTFLQSPQNIIEISQIIMKNL